MVTTTLWHTLSQVTRSPLATTTRRLSCGEKKRVDRWVASADTKLCVDPESRKRQGLCHRSWAQSTSSCWYGHRWWRARRFGLRFLGRLHGVNGVVNFQEKKVLAGVEAGDLLVTVVAEVQTLPFFHLRNGEAADEESSSIGPLEIFLKISRRKQFYRRLLKGRKLLIWFHRSRIFFLHLDQN